jgi:hypothetical protein
MTPIDGFADSLEDVVKYVVRKKRMKELTCKPHAL